MEPYFDPEYDNFSLKVNPPRVTIDNKLDPKMTIIKYDGPHTHGTLLNVVQALSDLDLNICKAYISSDRSWCLDVFYVSDYYGRKITDWQYINFINQTLGAQHRMVTPKVKTCLGHTVGTKTFAEHTVIEITGKDRPGLLCEIAGVLTSLQCSISEVDLWTHNTRVACIIHITDLLTSGPVEDSEKLCTIREYLFGVMKGKNDASGIRVEISIGLTHTERRLHQIMFADKDYEGKDWEDLEEADRPHISLETCKEMGYSVLKISCKDRLKLLFDIVCTLTDMHYEIFHGCAHSDGTISSQELYIRYLDGCTVDSEHERDRVLKCLEAAIERRISELNGYMITVSAKDKVGSLLEITDFLWENGLTITRADMKTHDNILVGDLYVSNTPGTPPIDTTSVKRVSKKMENILPYIINVSGNPKTHVSSPFKVKNLFNLKTHWERLSTNLGVTNLRLCTVHCFL